MADTFFAKKGGQVPLPGRPEGCFAQRYLTPFFPNALNAAHLDLTPT